MQPFVYEYAGLCAHEIFAGLADKSYSMFFDSADERHADSRTSYIAAFPVEIFEGRNFEDFKYKLAQFSIGKDMLQNLPPFQGGLAGLVTYEGDIRYGFYNQIMAFDHYTNRSWLIIHDDDQGSANIKRDIFLNSVSMPQMRSGPLLWQYDATEIEYKNQIKKIIDFIRAGDIFQANLSQRFTATLPSSFDFYAHYLHLRRVNSAPYACYMNLGDKIISSASPENFLNVQNRHVTTKPIKGTAVRHENIMLDKASAKNLQNSIKDRAENIMIVDLMRNDLSKVCTSDSVSVDRLCDLESFAGVHHLVSSVSGTLKEGAHALDLLKACHPGGSVTGAPKMRAMEILADLEQDLRGPYCGSAGWIGFNGDMQLNILIRTLVYENGQVSFRAGGGITAQSDPDQEYQETLDKAGKIFKSFLQDEKLKDFK